MLFFQTSQVFNYFAVVDSKVRFGTFPRGFDSSTQHNDVGGHGTFPRTHHMNRRPDLGNNTLRSIMSRGSEGTLSTSSSSSGLPPDPDMDSPEGRILYKRNSDIDSPVFNFPDYPFSKCKYLFCFRLFEHFTQCTCTM